MPSNHLISVAPFSCSQSFPAPWSFPVSWLFTSDGQSIQASASVLSIKNQGWFPLGLTGWISLLSKGLSESSPTPQFKSIILWHSTFYMIQFSHLYRTSLVSQRVKHLPAMQEFEVQSLGHEDPLEKGIETHSSILAWRIPWMQEPGRLQSTGSKDRTEWLHFTFTSVHDNWKTVALTIRIFVGKVMSPLFNTLSRLVITLFIVKESESEVS